MISSTNKKGIDMVKFSVEQQRSLTKFDELFHGEKLINKLIEAHIINSVGVGVDLLIDDNQIDPNSNANTIYNQVVNVLDFENMLNDMLFDFKNCMITKLKQIKLEQVVELTSIQYNKDRSIKDVEFVINPIE